MKLTSFVFNFYTALIFPIQVNPDDAVNVTNMLCILLNIIFVSRQLLQQQLINKLGPK